MHHKIYDSNSPTKTIFLASSIAKHIKGGEVFELISDLGGGKTTFTRGLLTSIDPKIEVFSPSFTICNEYDSKKFRIYHFDFYRLTDAGIIKNELMEALEDKTSVIVIEWSDIVSDILPENRIKINIRVTSENGRQLDLSYPDKYNYLFE